MAKKNLKNFYLILGITIYIFLLITYVNGSYPYVGHDYRYFLSRVLDVKLHFRENGFSVQWFTPSFGGGIPAYFNPQHTQFSLAQLLSFLFDPWTAILISMGTFSAIGYFACYQFGREIFGLKWTGATLSALFFSTSGFYLQRMAAGHFGYQPFPLTVTILLLLFSQRFTFWIRGLLIGFCLAIIVYNAGFYLLVVLGFTLLILYPLINLVCPDVIRRKQLLLSGMVGMVIGGILMSGKIFATLRFLEKFPRYVENSTFDSFADAINGFAMQFVGIPFLFLRYRLFEGGSQKIVETYLSTQVGLGRDYIWESDTSLSLVLILIFALTLVRWLNSYQETRQKFIRFFNTKKMIFLLLTWITVWFSFEYSTARGVTYSILGKLPVLGYLHTFRTAVSLVLPLSLLGGYFSERLLELKPKKKQLWLFQMLFLGTIAWILIYFYLPSQLQYRYVDLRLVNSIANQIETPKDFFVNQITTNSEETTQDLIVFQSNASSLSIYEPIFGYDLSKFESPLVPGSIYLQQDGKFNMHDPRDMILGEDELFTRFSIDEKDMMVSFANYQQPNWNLPKIFYILNTISLVGLILSIAALAVYFSPRLLRKSVVMRGEKSRK